MHVLFDRRTFYRRMPNRLAASSRVAHISNMTSRTRACIIMPLSLSVWCVRWSQKGGGVGFRTNTHTHKIQYTQLAWLETRIPHTPIGSQNHNSPRHLTHIHVLTRVQKSYVTEMRACVSALVFVHVCVQSQLQFGGTRSRDKTPNARA